jgi:hypothetical protein
MIYRFPGVCRLSSFSIGAAAWPSPGQSALIAAYRPAPSSFCAATARRIARMPITSVHRPGNDKRVGIVFSLLGLLLMGAVLVGSTQHVARKLRGLVVPQLRSALPECSCRTQNALARKDTHGSRSTD